MLVSVKLVDEHALYQIHLPNDEVVMMEGATVDDLIKQLKLPYKYSRVIKVNGKKGGLNTVLTDGDSVSIFPPVIGGG